MATSESVRHTLDIIDKGRLFCSAPASFNDPFECQVSISFDATVQVKNRRAKEHILRENQNMSESEAERIAATRWQQIERDGLQDLQHWLRYDTGVVSFSACNDDILMWSHYAGSHQGICIEFHCCDESHMDFFGLIQRVKYQQELPRINFYTTHKVKMAEALILTKAKHWSYEQEWRRIEDASNGNRFVDIPEGCISAIYLGCQLSEAGRQVILDHIEGSGSCKGIRVYQAERQCDAYGLSFKQISNG